MLLASSCQCSETAGAAPTLLHDHPCSGVLCSPNNSSFPLQAMKWDPGHLRQPQWDPGHPRPPQATSGKLGSTARAGKQRHLQLSAAISHQYNASSSTALWLCFCMWTSIFRNLGCARSARHRDCEDVCTPFCRMMCSELNGNNIVGARPVERKGP